MKTPDEIVEVHMILKNKFATRLLAEAKARDTSPVELLADILDAVLEDNLFVALLDN
jgi:hypothetical protein